MLNCMEVVVPSRRKRKLIKDSVMANEQNSSGVRNGLKQMEKKKTNAKVSLTRNLMAHWIQFLSSAGEDYENEECKKLAIFFKFGRNIYSKSLRNFNISSSSSSFDSLFLVYKECCCFELSSTTIWFFFVVVDKLWPKNSKIRDSPL